MWQKIPLHVTSTGKLTSCHGPAWMHLDWLWLPWHRMVNERLLLEQERQKARRSRSELSSSAISWLLDKREKSRHLLVSLSIGNALLGRSSNLSSGESSSTTQSNSGLLSKVCCSISSKNKRMSLQRSVLSMLSMVLPKFGCLVTSFSHFF